jgi:predicted metalloprotease with PDZ domain
MKKVFLPLFFLFTAACSDKDPAQDIAKAFERHSYEEYAPARIRELLRSKGVDGLKLLDRHAEVVAARKKFKKLPGGGGFSSGLLLAERGGGFYVAKVFRGSAAAATGLRDGDRVLEVGGIKAGSGVVPGLGRAAEGFTLKVERRTPKGAVEAVADLKKGSFSFPGDLRLL